MLNWTLAQTHLLPHPAIGIFRRAPHSVGKLQTFSAGGPDEGFEWLCCPKYTNPFRGNLFDFTSASQTFQPACQSLRFSKRKRCVRKKFTGWRIFSLESAKNCVFVYADCKGVHVPSNHRVCSCSNFSQHYQSTWPHPDCLLTFTGATGKQISNILLRKKWELTCIYKDNF